MILTFLLGVTGFGIIYYFIQWYELRKISGKFPGPTPYPVIGNLLSYPKDPYDFFQRVMSFNQEFGNTVSLHAFGLDWGVLITNPKDIEVILAKGTTSQKSSVYRLFTPWLGFGLLNSTGDKWHNRRKLITPTFHLSILYQFVEIFNQDIDVLIGKLKKSRCNGKDFNIYPYINLSALDSICRTAMGIEIDAQNNPNSEYVTLVKEIGSIIYQRMFKVYGRYDWLFDLTPLGKEHKRVVDRLHAITDNIIEMRKKDLLEKSKSPAPEPTGDDIGTKQKMTFLELLIQSTCDGKPLSIEDIREEVDTFMFGGHDTSTNATSCTIYQLSRDYDVQQKLYEEIVSVFGDDPSAHITYQGLQDLKYMEMVIKESLRLNPPVPLMGRKLAEDTVISGVKLPAGVDVTIPLYGHLRNPFVFPEPQKFDPERFSPENSEGRNPYSFIPFSAGPRNCIGQRYGMLEIKVFLTKLLLNFKILKNAGDWELKVKLAFVLELNGIEVQLAPRKD